MALFGKMAVDNSFSLTGLTGSYDSFFFGQEKQDYTGCCNQIILTGFTGLYRITFSIRQLFELSFDLDFVFSKVHD